MNGKPGAAVKPSIHGKRCTWQRDQRNRPLRTKPALQELSKMSGNANLGRIHAGLQLTVTIDAAPPPLNLSRVSESGATSKERAGAAAPSATESAARTVPAWATTVKRRTPV